MPTYERLDRFNKDLADLDPEDRKRFVRAIEQFVKDLREQGGFRRGLRVQRVEGTADVWEMTWAPDGRATWQYGPELIPGEPHIVWRRVGTHDIFRHP